MQVPRLPRHVPPPVLCVNIDRSVPPCLNKGQNRKTRQEKPAGFALDAPDELLRSDLAFDLQFLDPTNSLGRVQPLGACLGAVHDGTAGIQLERIFQ